MISATILAVLLWIETITSFKVQQDKNEFESEYIKKSFKQARNYNLHFWTSPTEKVYIRNYSIADSTGRTFRFEKFLNNELVYTLKANRIIYSGFPINGN